MDRAVEKHQVHVATVTNLSTVLATHGDWYTVAAFPHLVDVQIEDVVFTFLDDTQLSVVAPTAEGGSGSSGSSYFPAGW